MDKRCRMKAQRAILSSPDTHSASVKAKNKSLDASGNFWFSMHTATAATTWPLVLRMLR